MNAPEESLVQLRSAVARGDGPGVVAALATMPLVEVAQLAGDGLLVALAQGTEGAASWAEACARVLEERGWEGDDDLARQLAGALGREPAPTLRALPVDLEELSWILEGDGLSGGGRIDLRSGEVWPETVEGYDEGEEPEDAGDPDHWLYVECEGSHEGYRDMEAFVSMVDDPERADRLSIAIDGRGAFRRFKDVLARWPEEQARYFLFSEERRRARARSWLVSAGIAATPAAALKSGG
ncbi:MAG TPA: UPF0158 family protein [Acidimicrobiales bacterium]|nr:UPF0158 family protein [Acidimicrobiales bacterium]